MRIILNTRILRAQRTGIGTYVIELAAALQRLDALQLSFFDGREVETTVNCHAPSADALRPSWLRNIPGAYQIRRELEQRYFTRAARRAKADVYHDPTLWPLQFDGPIVMTVHDLTHINYAHTQPAARVREIERQLPLALERSARVLVDSQFIANELQQYYHIEPNKIVVAPLAHGEDLAPRRHTQTAGTLARYQLNHQRYFLFIGTLEPRKNLALALRAHAVLPASTREQYPLIILGGNGWQARDIEKALTHATYGGQVRNLGYVDRDDLADLLASAKAFIFPSLYEGFGIPVLEAMASGIPVISSNAACLPEVGGDAARYVDPHDEVGLSRLMMELIDDEAECKRLGAAGIKRAKSFSWEKCAALTAETYRAAATQ